MYKNQANKRMTRQEVVGDIKYGKVNLYGVYPGDSKDKDYSDNLTNSFVVLLTPTGIGSQSVTRIIIYSFLIAIVVTACIVIYIKK